MKTPLVTIFGGSGLLGRYAVRAFADAGWRIRAGVRHPNLAHYLPPMGHVGQIMVAKADVTDADSVAAAMRGADVVVNLVGVLTQSGHQSFEAIHVEGAETVARAAKAIGARLIHVSAIGADPDSDSSYAKSKGEGEARVRAVDPMATILRPSLAFGPEDNFFNRFAGLARMLPVLPLIGGGHTKFQPVFAGDIGDAILKCTTDETTQGKTYELGGPAVYSFKALMEFILRETGRSRALVPVPFFIASIKAAFLGMLPNPLLTMDQVRLLKHDTTVSSGALGFKDLGIEPDALEAVAPAYLWRFRAKGQYDEPVREKIIASSGT
ncbi:MAG TPA: complex I NDUFA9 subunit family protein [Rhizomicrobium sp.]|jgi:NADH dehydrogenase